MSEPKRPLVADVKDEIGSLAADLKKMAALRWQLARLELGAAVVPVKRLAITLLVAAALVLTALPILAVGAAELLDGWLMSCTGWLLIWGFGLLIGGGATGYLAWRRFRRRFALMEQTLEELREDVVWLRQWAGKECEGEK